MNQPTVPEVLEPASVVAEPVVTEAASDSGRLGRGAVAWSVFEGGRDPSVILITIYIFMPYVSATLVGDPVRGQELIARYAQYAGWIVMLTGPLLGAALHALYVVRVGGDFMHARFLLPTTFALLMPAAVVGVSAALACLTLVPIVAGVATIVLLLRPDARAWLRR